MFQRCVNGVVGAVCAALLLVPVFLQGGLWRHWSTLLFLLLVLVATFCSIRSEKRTYDAEEKLRQEYDTKTSRSNYLMRGGITYREGKDIRIYHAQPMIKNALREEERDKMVDGESRLERKAGLLDGSLSGLLMGGAYLFIVLRALSGALSAGSIVLFAAAVYRFSESLTLYNDSSSPSTCNTIPSSIKPILLPPSLSVPLPEFRYAPSSVPTYLTLSASCAETEWPSIMKKDVNKINNDFISICVI